ncbi:hypothetical protein [Helicobacter sp. T3_23-1059]
MEIVVILRFCHFCHTYLSYSADFDKSARNDGVFVILSVSEIYIFVFLDFEILCLCY